jgi:hypothetical protein
LENPRKGFLNHIDFIWGLAGIAFVSLFLILAAGSSDFSYDRPEIAGVRKQLFGITAVI